MTAYRGRLLSAQPQTGTPVYAAAFIRERRIVLERELLSKPAKLRLILVHELFHFVWARLGNTVRRQFSDLLRNEVRAGARGELGESAGVQKARLKSSTRDVSPSLWRNYICESFCDSAAWFYTGIAFADSRLAGRWRDRRRRWLRSTFDRIRAC